MYLLASPDGNTEGGEIMWELLYAVIKTMNSIAAGVIANYISKIIGKWLDE